MNHSATTLSDDPHQDEQEHHHGQAHQHAKAPAFWDLIKADLAPHSDRWKHATKLAVAGGLIIAFQQILHFEIMYPAMTVMLVVTELKGFSTVTRFVLNFIAATIGTGLAVVLSALFLQQPMFYLPVMWGYIIVIMYFLVSSRYRSTVFVGGYPFIVITYMVLFDKENAEHVATIVYRSVITGLACASLVMIFLWPLVPLNVLREKLIASVRRSRELLERIRKDLSGEAALDVNSFVPEYYRMQTPEMLMMLDNAQTDFSFDGATRHNLISLMAFESRVAACLSVAAEQVAEHHTDATPAVLELFNSFDERLEYMLEQLENPSIDGAVASPPLALAPPPEWLEPMQRVADEAGVVAPNINTFALLKNQPDFATETLRNLKQCLPNIFRLSVLKPNMPALKHATKCASAIMICAIFCIALNWDQGIGCVETVMLVVQATFGGTLLIGGLRAAGVVMGFVLSVCAVIFIVPLITTIPGFLLMFMIVLFVMGYVMHGAPRVSVPALQIVIVFDFSLLQLSGPSISLYPTMNFSLAVMMGVFVTFVVYRLLWPVRAGDELLPCLAATVESIASVVEGAAVKPLSIAQFDDARIHLDEDISKYMSFHNNLQLEMHCSAMCCQLQLRALSLAEKLCNETLLALVAEVGEDPMPANAIPVALVFADNLRRCASALRGVQNVELAPLPPHVEGDSEIAQWMRRTSDEIANTRDVFTQLHAMPMNAPTLMGLA